MSWLGIGLSGIGCAAYVMAMSMLGKRLAQSRRASSAPVQFSPYVAGPHPAVLPQPVFDARARERSPIERVSSG
jgi:hypothetical protein